MSKFNSEKALQYSEVFIVPQYSEVTSRSEVKTQVTVNHLAENKLEIDIPVISANMDTVTDGNLATEMWQAGGMGAIHRFMTVLQNLEEYKYVKAAGAECFVSVGVNNDYTRASALYAAGARYFVIDIAHGHSKMMKDMVAWLRDSFGDTIYIMAGNVATRKAIFDLVEWGVDAAKIGIGPGAVCVTKNITGVTVPQFSAVQNCCSVPVKTFRGHPLVRVADGGIQEIGDIAKALGAGADLVMSGRLFAACKEAPGPRINGQKIYRGMASRDAMLTIRDEKTLPTPEGVSMLINVSETSVRDVLRDVKGGLQSSFSYCNARNLQEFQTNVVFGVRA